jgi:broad specificity phosphatase PhoE
MRKLFYFIRHGESILNSKGIRQGSEGSLSDKGIEQAHITGRRIQNQKFDIMLVSPYQRTKETSEIINQYVKAPMEFMDLVHERRNPSEIVGKSGNDLEVRKIIDTIDKSFHNDNYRYSDEENFADMKERASKALEALSKRPEKKILVVTHGIFLKMMVSYMVHGDSLTASEYNALSFFNTSNNASITICEYKTGFFVSKKEQGWKVITWDDDYKK